MFEKAKLAELDTPAKPAQRTSRMEKSPEREAMRQHLHKGFGKGYGLSTTMTPGFQKKIGPKSYQAVERFIKRYVTGNDFPYAIKSEPNNGVAEVIVKHKDPETKAFANKKLGLAK